MKHPCLDCDQAFETPFKLGAHRRYTHPGAGKAQGRKVPTIRDASPDPSPGYDVEVGAARVHCATAGDAVELIGLLKAQGL